MGREGGSRASGALRCGPEKLDRRFLAFNCGARRTSLLASFRRAGITVVVRLKSWRRGMHLLTPSTDQDTTGDTTLPVTTLACRASLAIPAQPTQPHAGALCAAVLCSEIDQVFANQSVNSRVPFRGIAAHCGQHLVVYPDRDVPH